MYKELAILSLLAAAATTFPSNGLEDLSRSNVPLEKSEVLQTGNPDELIKESANSTAKSRLTRDCSWTFADDCSVDMTNTTQLLEHEGAMMNLTLDYGSSNSVALLQQLAMLAQGLAEIKLRG